MLFIQMITRKYDKTERSGEDMRKINALRFREISDPVEGIDLTGIEFFFDGGPRKDRVYPYTDHFRISERVYADKDGDGYIISYGPFTTRTAHRHFKPVMTLGDGEYGRIAYNERSVTFDGEWYYIRTTINLYCADASKLRKKMFFRKEADKLYEDMAYLRYCGDYHKA